MHNASTVFFMARLKPNYAKLPPGRHKGVCAWPSRKSQLHYPLIVYALSAGTYAVLARRRAYLVVMIADTMNVPCTKMMDGCAVMSALR